MPAASRASAWEAREALRDAMVVKKVAVEVWKADLWAARVVGWEGELVRPEMALLALARIWGICSLIAFSSWMRSAGVLVGSGEESAMVDR